MVTESEMHDFFSRVVSSVVGLSAQADELAQLRPILDQLRQQVDELNRRVEWLEQDRARLTTELNSMTDRAHAAEQERDHSNDDLDECRRTIGELQADLAAAVEQLNQTRSERDDLGHRFRVVTDEKEGLAYSLQQVQAQLAQTQADRDALAAKLEQVSAVFRMLSPSVAQS